MKWILLILFQKGATAVEFNNEHACEVAQMRIEWHTDVVLKYLEISAIEESDVEPYKIITHHCIPKGRDSWF
jgi:hypothetical protein